MREAMRTGRWVVAGIMLLFCHETLVLAAARPEQPHIPKAERVANLQAKRDGLMGQRASFQYQKAEAIHNHDKATVKSLNAQMKPLNQQIHRTQNRINTLQGRGKKSGGGGGFDPGDFFPFAATRSGGRSGASGTSAGVGSQVKGKMPKAERLALLRAHRDEVAGKRAPLETAKAAAIGQHDKSAVKSLNGQLRPLNKEVHQTQNKINKLTGANKGGGGGGGGCGWSNPAGCLPGGGKPPIPFPFSRSGGTERPATPRVQH